MIQFTTVVGVDLNCYRQLALSILTWRKFRPEIFKNPMIAFYDSDQISEEMVRLIVRHENCKFVPWGNSAIYDSQREKMLSGFVLVPPVHVETDWWVKIDTDVVSYSSQAWLEEAVFQPDVCFVGSPWSYTKPKDQMFCLNEWAKKTRLNEHDEPVFHGNDPNSNKLKHSRMCSWIFTCNTKWSKIAAQYAIESCPEGKIPVPSQDGYHFYIALRRHDKWLSFPFKNFGWKTISNFGKLKLAVEEIIGTKR